MRRRVSSKKATYNDPARRYSSVDLLGRWLKHAAGTRAIDRIPVLRELPGFRTGVIWKEILASFVYFYYLLMLPGVFYAPTLYESLYVLVYVFFGFLWPILVIWNAGNMLRMVPYRFRQRGGWLVAARVLLILAGLLIIFIGSFFCDYTYGLETLITGEKRILAYEARSILCKRRLPWTERVAGVYSFHLNSGWNQIFYLTNRKGE